MTDWIDEIKAQRDRGVNRALTQEQHAAVNSRYPGCTREHCCSCGEETGRAGRHDDSLFTDDGGPYCESCYEEIQDQRRSKYVASSETANVNTELSPRCHAPCMFSTIQMMRLAASFCVTIIHGTP